MMITCAVYREDGTILRVVTCGSEEYVDQANAAEFVVQCSSGTDDLNSYVKDRKVVKKEDFPIAINKSKIFSNGLDELIIADIPKGTKVMWPDKKVSEILDGEVRFSVDLPGVYIFKFTAIPYTDQEVTIEAVPAT